MAWIVQGVDRGRIGIRCALQQRGFKRRMSRRFVLAEQRLQVVGQIGMGAQQLLGVKRFTLGDRRRVLDDDPLQAT